MTDTTAPSLPSRRKGTFTVRSVARLIFAFGAALYLICQLSVILIPMKVREMPPGTADAYSYLSKARQLEDCFRQSCQALVDLREQLQPSPHATAGQNDLRVRRFHRYVYVYHLAHSAGAVALHRAGLSWEHAINVLSVMGALAIALGTVWLLYGVFGTGPAGVALFLLAFAVYPGWHGTHWIVPGNFAYGIGVVMWAAIVARLRAMAWLMPLLCLIAVWLHPAGQIQSGMAILLWLLLAEKRDVRVWTSAILSSVAVVSPSVTGFLVDDPVMRFTMFVPPEDWTWSKGLAGNFKGAWKVILDWLKSYGGPGILILAIAGLFAVPPARRRAAFVFSGLVVLIAAGSMVYVLPHYPAELFHRVWIAVSVAMAGLAGMGVWALATRQPPFVLAGMRGTLRLLIVSLGIVLVAYTLITQTLVGAAGLRRKTDDMINWGRMSIDIPVAQRVIATMKPGERILYRDELALFLYTTYGAGKYGAIYYRGMVDTPEEKKWLAADKNVRYVVFSIEKFFGRVWLYNGARIVITPRSPQTTKGLWLKFENPGPATEILLSGKGAPLKVPAGHSGWIHAAPGFAPGKPQKFTLTRPATGPVVWVRGIRLTRNATTTWPWDAGAIVAYYRPAAWERNMPKNKRSPHVSDFALSTLIPKACTRLGPPIEGGAIVAVEVSCDSGKPGQDK